MDQDEQQIKRPLWVKVGLWGLRSRASAMAFFWLALALAAAFVACGIIDRRLFFGGIFLFSAAWYYACIQWVDRHNDW